MIHRIDFLKAILAGVAGAVAWEVLAVVMLNVGVSWIDIVRVLGTVPGIQLPIWQWWPIGMALHCAVGAIWAVFYAYFFWSIYEWRPVFQGMAFSLLPMVLAGMVMVPALGDMHPGVQSGAMASPGWFAVHLGPTAVVSVVVSHLLWGAVMGSLYVRVVGYPTNKRDPVKWRPYRKPARPQRPRGGACEPGRFMFATGIECSYPRVLGGRWRMDELEATEHYRYWQRDLELVHELGLRYLRYGPPYHLIHQGRGKYDWSFTDQVTQAMEDLGIEPIMDLCHFGVPDWLGTFQNDAFPEAFAEYAGAFAARYPGVKLYTPINEMYVTARMSTLDGVWNEQIRTERAYVTATRHVAKASLLGIHAILRQNPRARFVNSESSEFFQACCPDPHIQQIADFENQRRFIALDLLYGVPLRPDVLRHMLDHGMPREEYEWFMSQRVARYCVLGIDYYTWNEKVINHEGRPESLGELFGWFVIVQQYYRRYGRPLMHTETNHPDARDAPGWLWRQWHNVQMMRRSGVPVVGMTWYSLQDQVDWNVGLSRPEGEVNPVGLFDLNREPHAVAQAYRHLVQMYGNEPMVEGVEVSELADLLPAEGAQP